MSTTEDESLVAVEASGQTEGASDLDPASVRIPFRAEGVRSGLTTSGRPVCRGRRRAAVWGHGRRVAIQATPATFDKAVSVRKGLGGRNLTGEGHRGEGRQEGAAGDRDGRESLERSNHVLLPRCLESRNPPPPWSRISTDGESVPSRLQCTSPPARVPRSRQNCRLVVEENQRTEPSAIDALTPPGW